MKLLLLVAFLVGFGAGRWDAKHGYDFGLKAGKWTAEKLGISTRDSGQ